MDDDGLESKVGRGQAKHIVVKGGECWVWLQDIIRVMSFKNTVIGLSESGQSKG